MPVTDPRSPEYANSVAAKNAEFWEWAEQVERGLASKGYTVRRKAVSRGVVSYGISYPDNYVMDVTKMNFTVDIAVNWYLFDKHSVSSMIQFVDSKWQGLYAFRDTGLVVQPDPTEPLRNFERAGILPEGFTIEPTVVAAPAPSTDGAQTGTEPTTVPQTTSGAQTAPTTTAGTVSGGATPGTMAVQVPASVPSNEVAAMTLKDQVFSAAVAATGRTTQTWDQWNYYLSQITGSPGPGPERFGITRTDPMPLISIDEWWQHVGPLFTGGVSEGPARLLGPPVSAPADGAGVVTTTGGAAAGAGGVGGAVGNVANEVLGTLQKNVELAGTQVPIWALAVGLFFIIRYLK